MHRFVLLLAFAAALHGIATATEPASRGARVDLITYRCRVEGNHAYVDKYRRMTVLDPSGDEYAHMAESEDQYCKLTALTIRQLDRSGKRLLQKTKRDLTRQCGLGQYYQLYDDNCTYSLDVPSRPYPYTIESESRMELRSLFFVRGLQIQCALPVTRAEIELEFPDDYPVAWKLYGLDVVPQETIHKGRHTLQWVMDSIAADPEIEYAAPQDRAGIRLAFCAERFELEGLRFDGRTWKNVGLWQRELSTGRFGADSVVAEPRPVHNADSLAAAQYREVTAAIRYVSISIGLSGWQPNIAEATMARGYGDCKDMSCLLTAKLHASGIEAYPCLVMTSTEGWLDTTFVGFQFNHVITMAVIDHDTLWFDPTCNDCPPGDLPSSDEGIPVLAITDSGGVLVTTPMSTATQNRVQRFTELTIDSAGALLVTASAKVTGNLGYAVRSALRGASRDKTSQYLKEWFLTDDRKFSLIDGQVTNLDTPDKEVRLDAHFRAPKPIDRVGGIAYVIPFLFPSRDAFGDAGLAERKLPLDLRYPVTILDSVVVRGPMIREADSIRLPPEAAAHSAGGFATSRYWTAGDSIGSSLSVSYTVPSIPADSLASFATFLAQRRKMLDAPVRIYVENPEP